MDLLLLAADALLAKGIWRTDLLGTKYTMAQNFYKSRPIARRFDDATVERLETLRRWDWDYEKIKRSITAIQLGDLTVLEGAEWRRVL